MLLAQGVSGLTSVSIPNIYIKMPYEITNKKGRVVTKQRYTPITAVVATRLEEDKDEQEDIILEVEETGEQIVRYRGAYLIISNRFDALNEVLSIYTKRWRIEIFGVFQLSQG